MALSPLISDPNDPFSQIRASQSLQQPPSPDISKMGEGIPQISQGLQPLVTSQRNQQEQGLQGKISAYENPTKPQGFWQNVRHVAATIGNVAGDVFAPATMSLIPGTQLHNQVQQGRNIKELAGLQNEDRLDQTQAGENSLRNAQTAASVESTAEAPGKAKSLEDYQGAETAHTQAETEGLENPSPDYEVHDTQEGPMIVNKKTGLGQHLSVDGKPVGPKVATKTVQLEIGGKPHQVLINDADGSVIRDMGMSGEKPPTVNVNAGDKEQAALKKQVYTAYTPVMDSAERFNVMSKNYEDAIQTHDQQAMLSLLYNHMGMTMGLQKGARMTQALIQEAQKSQPWLNNISAKFDKDGYLSGVTLSPRQMQEMVHNAQGRYSEDVGKARNESQYLGSKDDGPARTPNTSTVNYYMGMANGNINRAKQLASQDGWTIQ